MRFALDSSFLGKLFFREKWSDEADEIMKSGTEKDVELIASELVLYEVANIIWKRLRKTEKDGRELLQRLPLLYVDYFGLDGNLMHESMEVAQASYITFYDAVHVALAKRENVNLVTEDFALLRKFDHTVCISDAIDMVRNLP